MYTYSPRDRIPAPRRPIRRRFRWECCRPTKTTPALWSRRPACRRGAPTAPNSARPRLAIPECSLATATCCWDCRLTRWRPATVTTRRRAAAR
ncbi:hypothetical protein I553_1807 [Mycobacterium xenopi 4042]|uniref:Uncharacterized protein n=1 Tax=Mycobacterium xenopi 4042 TaxID=1299334 RepID=X8DJN6_MYCXE|nr:hypothetical protein I553_1807 [Mycobacterium xenopi 4042]